MMTTLNTRRNHMIKTNMLKEHGKQSPWVLILCPVCYPTIVSSLGKGPVRVPVPSVACLPKVWPTSRSFPGTFRWWRIRLQSWMWVALKQRRIRKKLNWMEKKIQILIKYVLKATLKPLDVSLYSVWNIGSQLPALFFLFLSSGDMLYLFSFLMKSNRLHHSRIYVFLAIKKG